jgi:hypothetical protein
MACQMKLKWNLYCPLFLYLNKGVKKKMNEHSLLPCGEPYRQDERLRFDEVRSQSIGG